MRYEGDIYRPPSEAYSLLVQVTIGCTHNKCTFCKMFKNKKFRVRKLEEVLEDLAWARAQYRSVPRIFLCDGDAMALSNARLMPILNYIRENFPECERVSIYGRGSDIIKKTDEEMKELYDAGLTMVYVGADHRWSQEGGSLRHEVFRYIYFRSCGKRRLGGSCDPDRNYDQRNGTILCWTSDIDRGAERSDGQGNRRWDIYSADSGRGYGGNAFDAGTHRCI